MGAAREVVVDPASVLLVASSVVLVVVGAEGVGAALVVGDVVNGSGAAAARPMALATRVGKSLRTRW